IADCEHATDTTLGEERTRSLKSDVLAMDVAEDAQLAREHVLGLHDVASWARKPRSFQFSRVSSAVTSVKPRRIAVATSIRSAGSACESGSSAAEIPISPSSGSS